jgi:hypothetical protein
MLGFLKRLARKRLNFEQLQILQLVAQQVVLSVEGSVQMPGAQKKAIAVELAGQILEEMGLVAPDSLIDAMIESAVRILKSLDKVVENEAQPKYSFDISGRPRTGH